LLSRWVALAAGVGVLFAGACSEDLPQKPDQTITDEVEAYYQSPEDFGNSPIELNGEALDREWGGPLQEGRSYSQIRLSAENGSGDPGPPLYVSMKAVYTERDLFLLLRWPDDEPDEFFDRLTYVGPSFPRFEIRCGPEYADTSIVRDTLAVPSPGYDEVVDCPGSDGDCDTFYVRESVEIDPCDTVRVRGCQDVLVAPDSWILSGDEDRIVIAFEMQATGDGLGEFKNQGCLVACHVNETPNFGRPAYGRLDIWQWLGSRTNPVRDLYISTDNPSFPLYGTPGYLDDMVADPSTGLVPDPGLGTFSPNHAPDSAVPYWIYRCEDDPLCEPQEPTTCTNVFGERCKINNGLSLNFVWRENRQFERFVRFSRCDTLNRTPPPLGTEPRPWRAGDTVPGFSLTYPEGSRADIHGAGQWENGFWTLEVARFLRTGDSNNDIQFTAEAGLEIQFALALMDNSGGEAHWGSQPQTLRFGPKE
jgi:hypothetical protein